ncbi:glycosyltransferase [Aquirufa rosea]|uniref:Glycosyltransferase n=1 Tax=Aquirufa rosea TaxID=2509241 RepID=A0A4Q1C0Z2_9BACT|nr:glycosyltransferase [Aquirufa rosea]RXK50724.1 glycosyltransferase [Aquirufa rosea]
MKPERPLKIVLLSYHDQNGGAAIACGRLHEALTQAGHDVKTLVQKKGGIGPSQSLETSIWKKWMTWVRFVSERLYFLLFEKDKSIRFHFNPGIFGQDISRHPALLEADIIHLHWINFGFLSIDSIEKILQLNKPVFWTLHDMWAFTGGCHHSGDCLHFELHCGKCKFLACPKSEDISHRLWAAKQQKFQYPNLHIITCSEWLGQRAESSSILKGRTIQTIANPIDVGLFKMGDKTEAKKSLGLDPAKQYLLFVAMRVNAPAKGFHYLKKALDLWVEKYPEQASSTELLVVGEISDLPTIQSLPLALRCLGIVHDPNIMMKAYQAAEMFITPSLEENLPNTIMEAMACGTPCLGFQIGGIPEMIEHQINGYVAQFQNAKDLSEGIAYIFPKSKELGLAARKKVESHYEASIIAEKHIQYYQTCL